MDCTTKRKEQSEKLRSVKSSYQSSTLKSGRLSITPDHNDYISHFIFSDFFFRLLCDCCLLELARSLPSRSVQENTGAGLPPDRLPVLDEQHLVASLVVDQLIHQVAGHEDAETAGALSPLRANLDVLDGRIVRIGNGRVWQQVHREALAGVLNPHNQGARRAHQRNAHALPGVGAAAVLDGI